MPAPKLAIRHYGPLAVERPAIGVAGGGGGAVLCLFADEGSRQLGVKLKWHMIYFHATTTASKWKARTFAPTVVGQLKLRIPDKLIVQEPGI